MHEWTDFRSERARRSAAGPRASPSLGSSMLIDVLPYHTASSPHLLVKDRPTRSSFHDGDDCMEGGIESVKERRESELGTPISAPSSSLLCLRLEETYSCDCRVRGDCKEVALSMALWDLISHAVPAASYVGLSILVRSWLKHHPAEVKRQKNKKS
jgi:hypothetical protein